MQLYGLLLILVASSTHGFLTTPQRSVQRCAFRNADVSSISNTCTRTSSLSMAGFGAAPSNKDSKQKATKLKPRQQWDRYTELKDSETVRVAVRVIGSAPTADTDTDNVDANKWLEVGSVKSKNDEYTQAAVIRHRLLIAEHGRRVFPIQISAKDSKDNKLEWAYFAKSEEDWVMVADKVDMPEDIEKMSGFVGLPDSSGFYTKSTEQLADNTVKGYANMKKKGIVGFIGMEVHD
jgi:hypothetical protein